MSSSGYERRDSYHVATVHESFLAEVLMMLRKPQKELPSKYLYDERGSQLFERICDLQEYYLPRIEASIMQACINEVAEKIGPRAFLIEYGSGNCEKVRFLLDNIHDPVAYAPIDISWEQLAHVARGLASEYPGLEICPVCADFLSHFDLPTPKRPAECIVVYFPGSTIGNLDPISATRFLESVAGVCGRGGALLIGVDLKKAPAVLHSAYNDKEGITAAFNLNLLQRLNRELGCDFQPESFQHYAFYNPWESRVEMHLVSQRDQVVHINGEPVAFDRNESIWTESSYKYNLDEFEQITTAAGFEVEQVWLDDQQWFSVQYLVAR
ncbi:MAG: L-histidine N(alpha)-methyltransferase [Dehalococcoidia bacterium]